MIMNLAKSALFNSPTIPLSPDDVLRVWERVDRNVFKEISDPSECAERTTTRSRGLNHGSRGSPKHELFENSDHDHKKKSKSKSDFVLTARVRKKEKKSGN